MQDDDDPDQSIKRRPTEPAVDFDMLQLIGTLSFDGLLAFDSQCRYTIWNQGMEVISGMPHTEVLNREAFHVFPFLKSTGEDRYFINALQGAHITSRNRPYEIRETGRRGFFDAAYAPILTHHGRITGGICVVRDVTNRVVAEEFFEKSRTVDSDGESILDLSDLPQRLLPKLGRAIKQRRLLMLMSQEELGFRSGLHRTYISDVERGVRNLSISNVVRLAQALNLFPWVLIAQTQALMQSESSDLKVDDSRSQSRKTVSE